MIHYITADTLFSNEMDINGLVDLIENLPGVQPGDRINIMAHDENPEWMVEEDHVTAISTRDVSINLIVGGLETYNNSLIKRLGIKHQSWAQYFFYRVYQDTLNLQFQNVVPKYHFLCMNNQARYHRCYFMDQLHKHNLQSYGKISWHKLATYDRYKWQYWNPKLLHFDSQPLGSDINATRYILPKEWYETAFNIVTETDINKTFFTEKTVMPLLIGKPFLVLGAPRFHLQLLRMGFKLYDDIFDYSFDDEGKLFDRTAGIIRNLNILKDLQPAELYDICKDKIEHNRKNAIRLAKMRIPKIYTNYINSLNQV
jgi:hypothetical protein